MFTAFIKLLLAVVLACLVGKLVSKLKLPAILGWLIAGMILGPHAVALVDQSSFRCRDGIRHLFIFWNVRSV